MSHQTATLVTRHAPTLEDPKDGWLNEGWDDFDPVQRQLDIPRQDPAAPTTCGDGAVTMAKDKEY